MSTQHEEHIHIHEDSSNDNESSNPLVRIVVIIGIVLILLLIALSIVKMVPKFISSFGGANVSLSSLFSSKSKFNITATPTKVKSGNTFTVTWQNDTNDSEGVNIWSYKCVDGVSIEYYSISGPKPVICDTNFPLPAMGNSYSFTAKTENKTLTVIPMTVSMRDTEMTSVKYSSSADLTIIPEGYIDNSKTSMYEPSYNSSNLNATSTKATLTTNLNPSNSNSSNTGSTPTRVINTQGSKNSTKTTTTYTNSGTPDLKVVLTNIGRTRSDGSFEQTSNFVEDDRVTVRFNVSNIGTKRSGFWILKANLPTKTPEDKLFISNNQPALSPGDSYEMTISFDTFDPNSDVIQIIVDINDQNSSNNILVIPVSSSGGSNNNNTGSQADLSVRVIDVGIMRNNRFYETSSLDSGDMIAVKFEVENVGSKSTGSWRFTVDLPTEDGDTFKSNMQSSLSPREKKQYTIGFDNPDTGYNDVIIEVDSDDDVSENSESNNDDSERIYVNN